jgi:hypothetical protein
MNTEDDEFNRVEREAKQRREAVAEAIKPKRFDFYEGIAEGRATAFVEIHDKIKAMPFNDDTIDSLLIWLKEQQ